MKLSTFIIKENVPLTKAVYKMVLKGNVSEISKPGQFVNTHINGFYLPRPISITTWNTQENTLTLIYKNLGKGTASLTKKTPGHSLKLLLPLGNGFDIGKCGKTPVLVGGGVGVPPMVALCEAFLEKNIKPSVVLGFNGKDDVFGESLFQEMGIDPIITTIDGSYGLKGLVLDALKNTDYDYIYGCGPEPMLKALSLLEADSQLSFEARMACGFGVCMGCTCETKYGYKRICKDGPVLFKEEIKW